MDDLYLQLQNLQLSYCLSSQTKTMDFESRLAAATAIAAEAANAEAVKVAEQTANYIVSYDASMVRQLVEQNENPNKIKIWTQNLVDSAIKAVSVIEAASVLEVPSIDVRISHIANERKRWDQAISENKRISYWKKSHDSIVAKWKFVEIAEQKGMSIRDMHIITYSNPYMGTSSEEDTVKSTAYWQEQIEKVLKLPSI
jgi:hypothetical protein